MTLKQSGLGSPARMFQEVDPKSAEAIGVPRGIEGFLEAQVLVVLGDPGLGKTFLLQSLREEPVEYVTARRASNPDGGLPAGRALIDGLDEVSGDITDAMERISGRLSAAGSPQVVISCRVQDWRSGTALRQLRETYGDATLRVVVLQPLDEAGALSILEGEVDDPAEFVRIARQKGVDDFLRNPNDLLLLVEATKSGWPTDRIELLNNATRAVLSETNAFHSDRIEIPVGALMTAAGWACASILIAGVDDTRSDGSDLANASAAGISTQHVHQAFRSRLFASPGPGTLHPRHRTIAEFLAGQWLAGIVVDARMEARVRALVLAADGAPPASLRAVYAWLVRFMEPERVARWVDADPVGLVLYGDVSALSKPLKLALLESLIRHVVRDQSLGGYIDQGERWRALLGTDTDAEVSALLLDPAAPGILKNHLLDGAAVHAEPSGLIPTLLQLATDRSCPEEVRRRAIRAYLKAGAIGQPIWTMVDQMNAGQEADPQFQLRSAALRAAQTLTVPMVLPVIEALARSVDAVPHGRVSYSFESLPTNDLAPLLDGVLALPRQPRNVTRASRNISRDMDNVLARIVRRILLEKPEALTDDRLAALHCVKAMALPLGNGIKTKLAECAQASPQATIALFDRTVLAGDVDGILPRFLKIFDLGSPLLLPPDESLVGHMVGKLEMATDPRLSLALCQCIFNAGVRLKEGDARTRLEVVVRARQELSQFEPGLNPAPVPEWQRQREAQEQVRLTAVEAGLRVWRTHLEADRSGIRDWTDTGTLQWLGEVYADPLEEWGENAPGKGRAANLEAALGSDLVAEVVFDMIVGLRQAPTVVAHELAALAAMDLTHAVDQQAIENPAAISDTLAGALMLAWLEEGQERRDPSTNRSLGHRSWPNRLVARRPDLVERVLLGRVIEGLAGGDDHVPGLYQIAHAAEFERHRSDWSVKILTALPDLRGEQAYGLFQGAMSDADDVRLAPLAEAALAKPGLSLDSRARWSALAWVLDPVGMDDAIRSLLVSGPETVVWAVVATLNSRRLRANWSRLTEAHLVTLLEILPRRFPYVAKPSGGAWGGTTNAWDGTDIVVSLINELAARGTATARDALQDLSGQWPGYAFEFGQATTGAAVAARDVALLGREIGPVSASLLGGPPADLPDAIAATVAELKDLEDFYRTGQTSNWRKFWNLDRDSRTSNAIRIKGENECRNYLVVDLVHRLRGFRMRPEEATANDDRLDIAVVGEHGMFPIEVKHHDNPELWTAAASQLSARYARDYDAGGQGIYLVIWSDRGRDRWVTAPPAPRERPTSPGELQKMLTEQLSQADRDRVTVVVMDLSRPSQGAASS